LVSYTLSVLIVIEGDEHGSTIGLVWSSSEPEPIAVLLKFLSRIASSGSLGSCWTAILCSRSRSAFSTTCGLYGGRAFCPGVYAIRTREFAVTLYFALLTEHTGKHSLWSGLCIINRGNHRRHSKLQKIDDFGTMMKEYRS